MASAIHLVILSVIISEVFAGNDLKSNQDVGLNIVSLYWRIALLVALTVSFQSQYLSKYGYEFEEHPIETEDGFVLSLHRIPAQSAGAPVVFLVHAFLSSAFDWVSQGPGTSLALLLWDLGKFLFSLNYAKLEKETQRKLVTVMLYLEQQHHQT